jgi:hypothetical protein
LPYYPKRYGLLGYLNKEDTPPSNTDN